MALWAGQGLDLMVIKIGREEGYGNRGAEWGDERRTAEGRTIPGDRKAKARLRISYVFFTCTYISIYTQTQTEDYTLCVSPGMSGWGKGETPGDGLPVYRAGAGTPYANGRVGNVPKSL